MIAHLSFPSASRRKPHSFQAHNTSDANEKSKSTIKANARSGDRRANQCIEYESEPCLGVNIGVFVGIECRSVLQPAADEYGPTNEVRKAADLSSGAERDGRVVVASTFANAER